MNTLLKFVATVLLVSGPVFSQQSSTNAQKSHTTHVQARGCVRPGKEEGCFVLHDIKRRHYYDLSFDAVPNKPDLYTHISFEGIGYAHDAHCSEGRPVHVSSWKPLPGECAKPAGSRSKAKIKLRSRKEQAVLCLHGLQKASPEVTLAYLPKVQSCFLVLHQRKSFRSVPFDSRRKRPCLEFRSSY